MFCWMLASCSIIASAQPATNQLLLVDNFDGTTLDTTTWKITGTVTVSGGEVHLSGTSSLQLNTGYLQCPLVVKLNGVRFETLSGSSSDLVVQLRSQGNPTVIGATDYEIFITGTTMMDGIGYGQGSLQGFSIGNTYNSLPTTPADYTFGYDWDGVSLYINTFQQIGQGYPTLTAGRVTPALFTAGTASMSCSSIAVYSGFETSPVVRYAPKNTTSTLDFGPAIGCVAQVRNNSTQSYGVLTAEKITSSPTNLGGQVPVGGKIWNISGMNGLSTSATLTMTVPLAEASSLGLNPAQLQGFKSNDNGQTWISVPGSSVNVSNGNIVFTWGTINSFSHFAIAGSIATSVREWQLYD
jgi:hypothetical protein